MGPDAGQARFGVPRPRVPTLSRRLHPTDMGRAHHAPAGVSALREAHDNVGAIRRLLTRHRMVPSSRVSTLAVKPFRLFRTLRCSLHGALHCQ